MFILVVIVRQMIPGDYGDGWHAKVDTISAGGTSVAWPASVGRRRCRRVQPSCALRPPQGARTPWLISLRIEVPGGHWPLGRASLPSRPAGRRVELCSSAGLDAGMARCMPMLGWLFGSQVLLLHGVVGGGASRKVSQFCACLLRFRA